MCVVVDDEETQTVEIDTSHGAPASGARGARYQRILNVVANPRPFIKTKTYFGPDRRRNTSNAYIGPERRVGGDAEVLQQPSLLDKARTPV